MGFTNSIKMSAMKTAFGYIEKKPEENLLTLLGWVDKLAGEGPDSFPAQRAAFRSVLENPDSKRNPYSCGVHCTPSRRRGYTIAVCWSN